MPDEQTMRDHIEDLLQERDVLWGTIRKQGQTIDELQQKLQMHVEIQGDKDRLINKLRAWRKLAEAFYHQFYVLEKGPFTREQQQVLGDYEYLATNGPNRDTLAFRYKDTSNGD